VPVYAIEDLSDFCKNNNVSIAVLTVPKEAAYDVALVAADSGVKGIWNFANMELKLGHPEVIVENIHLGDSLMTLCYEIKTANEKREDND
jgi:redox-sensing transcriptional repressor